ncbi:hypothetical protein [Halolamina sp.]|jgi:hypothetical protein|uniref:DUF7529 family protein n=1 Tax=Halolamina sp. TaxID=1940283 RepID=UPI000223BF79|nr:hypothetical protein Halar_2760 [halophilic archaeon DL31]
MDSGHPLSGLSGLWEDTIADMETTATEFRDAGWETVELHPGAVTPLPAGETEDGYLDERVGLDVLVPGDEFALVKESVGGIDGEEGTAVSYDEYEAFRAQQNEVVFLVVAMKSTAAETAVLIPLYYDVADAAETLERVRERDEMRLFVRPLDDSERVVFSQQSPEALLPEQS